MKRMRDLEGMFREEAKRPEWPGYTWIPQRRKQWRFAISSSDLKSSSWFEKLRRLLDLPNPTWANVLEACAGLDQLPEDGIRDFVQTEKMAAYERMCRILPLLGTKNQVLLVVAGGWGVGRGTNSL